MKHLFIIIFSVIAMAAMAQTIKFTQIEPSTTKYQLPVAEKQIQGQTGKYYLKYMSLAELQDSVGCCTDSIYIVGDTIKLRDGSGYVVLKDTSSNNELAKYVEGTSFIGTPKQGDLWYDNKVALGIPNNQIYIYNNGSWQLLRHRDLYRQIGFDDLYTDECHEIIEFNQPLTGVPPIRHISKTISPIKISSSTEYGLAEHTTTTIYSIDTAALVNIILDSIPPPTPSADSTIVSAGYGITVTEAPSNTFTVKADTSALATNNDLTLKQDNLISGTNIKTVNGNSLLGSGNVSVGTVTGTGTAKQVAFWNGTNSLSSSGNLYWDVSLNRLILNQIPFTSWTTNQVAIGFDSGIGSSNAYNSCFVGTAAGYGALNAHSSNFFGDFAGNNSLNAHSSNFFGDFAGYHAYNASNSNFIGNSAGNSASWASYSNFFGFNAGMYAVNASNSNFFGFNAGYNANGASHSNFFGYDTGSPNIGSNNIIIGKSITLPDGTNNAMNLGGVVFGIGFNNGQKTSNAVNGKIGINKVTPVTTLHVGGDATIDNLAGTDTRMVVADSTGTLSTQAIPSGGSGATQYLNAYIDNTDTLGFYLTVAQDTVVFRGVNNVSGESTTVGDTPTIDMTLTGSNITASVVDGSITPAKLSQTYLTSEVDGSVSNELQTLSIAGNQLSISNGNTVTLPSGGSTEWASLDYGTQAANTQSFTSSVWNTINFLGSNESNSAIINANHTNDDIEFVVAGNYKIDYAVSFVGNADALIYMGLHSSVTNDVPFKTQIEGDTDVGYKTCQMSKSIIYSATSGEKLKLQIQPLTAHTSVGVYAHFIITKL